MKKNVHIQLAGYAFLIEEDAYQILQDYLNRLKSLLQNERSRDEILSDVDFRLAELWFEKHKSNIPVSLTDVNEAIKILGEPEKIIETLESPKTEPLKIKKKFYRNPDDYIIGGVCGGIAAYLGVDSTWVRIAAVVLLFLAGSSFWIYLLLWLIVPEASSPTEKLAMYGESWTRENLKQLSDANSESKSAFLRFFSRNKKTPLHKTALYPILKIAGIILGGFCLFLGVIFFISVMATIIGFTASEVVSDNFTVISNVMGGSFIWIKVWVVLLLTSLFLFFSYTGFKLTFRIRGSKWAYPLILLSFLISIFGLSFSGVRSYKNLSNYASFHLRDEMPEIRDSVEISVCLSEKDWLSQNKAEKMSMNFFTKKFDYYFSTLTQKKYVPVRIKILTTKDSIAHYEIFSKVYGFKGNVEIKPENVFSKKSEHLIEINPIIPVSVSGNPFQNVWVSIYIPQKTKIIKNENILKWMNNKKNKRKIFTNINVVTEDSVLQKTSLDSAILNILKSKSILIKNKNVIIKIDDDDDTDDEEEDDEDEEEEDD
jgi:phage shock protein PspC (stress-responsive transcriptional regulator)